MSPECDNCGRRARYAVREADTGVEYPACTPQGCTDKPPAPLSPLVPCAACDGRGTDGDRLAGPTECPVCAGAGQTTATRHRAWEITHDLTGGPVLLDPDCWWTGGGRVLVGPAGYMGTVRQMGAQWIALLPNGLLQSFPGRDMAEVWLYEQYREVSA